MEDSFHVISNPTIGQKTPHRRRIPQSLSEKKTTDVCSVDECWKPALRPIFCRRNDVYQAKLLTQSYQSGQKAALAD
jgi:hypothetical protein